MFQDWSTFLATVEDREVAALLICLGCVLYMVRYRSTFAELRGWGWLAGALGVRLVSYLVTVFEGLLATSLQAPVNLLEHSLNVGHTLLLVAWIWVWVRGRTS